MAPKIWFPDGGRIMLEATVREQATGNKEMAVDASCVMARSPYTFKFTRSQKYFKPSLPYDVKVSTS